MLGAVMHICILAVVPRSGADGTMHYGVPAPLPTVRVVERDRRPDDEQGLGLRELDRGPPSLHVDLRWPSLCRHFGFSPGRLFGVGTDTSWAWT